MSRSNGGQFLLDEHHLAGQWEHRLSSLKLGQFAAACLNDSTIELYTDPNGLRSFFVHESDAGAIFSTHLHLITSLTGVLDLDLSQFGSHWFSHNQMNKGSLVRGVGRICAGDAMELRASPCGASVIRRPRPVGRDCPDSPLAWVGELLNNIDLPIALSLSGGLDSRVLLGLAQSAGIRPRPFVFGDERSPDVQIAQMAAAACGLECLHVPSRSLDDCVLGGDLERYARDNWCATPLSAAGHLTSYDRVFESSPGAILIDGGFGEIGRGQFYRRVEVLRKLRRLHRGPLGAVMSAVSFKRVNVFRTEALAMMTRGVESAASEFRDQLVAARSSRPEDTVAARIRRQNFFGLTQGWMDSQGPSLMPFAQEAFVRSVLKIPSRERVGGRLFRRLLKAEARQLTRLPLAKGRHALPFRLPSPLYPLHFRLAAGAPGAPSAFGGAATRQLLYDSLNSLHSREWVALDHARAEQLLDSFYAGQRHLESEVSWLGAVLLWRMSNSIN